MSKEVDTIGEHHNQTGRETESKSNMKTEATGRTWRGEEGDDEGEETQRGRNIGNDDNQRIMV